MIKKLFKKISDIIKGTNRITAKKYPVINKITKRGIGDILRSWELYLAQSGYYCILDRNAKDKKGKKTWYAISLETKDRDIAVKIMEKTGLPCKPVSWQAATQSKGL